MPNRLVLKTVLVSMLILAHQTATAGESDLEKALNDRYRNQILVLRHPVRSDHLDIDQNGDFKEGQPEPWTLYGRVLVDEFKLGPDQLEVKCTRVVYEFEPKPNLLVPHKTKSPFTVRIRLQKPLETLAETMDALGKVFALTPEDVVKSVPRLWQPYLKQQMGLFEAANIESPKDSPDASQQKSETTEDQPVKIGNGVKPPRVKYQPEPDFSEEARRARFEGIVGLNIVIDRNGAVKNVQLVRPMGMGLDEKAVEGVKAWKFDPATLNGKPVAVGLYVEVDFHLYDRQR